ncbi:MAG: hypothetical protein EPO07_13225, partial [Verrucomicrobia bacterium]
CLPLALLLGYLMADPLDSSSLGIVVMVISVLLMPLLMKWHHPLLVLTCNSAFTFTFLPGSPPMWIPLAAMGLVFALLNRAVDANRRLLVGGQVVWSLLALSAVVLITALSTGGVNIRSMGGATYGGSRYFFIFGAVAMYFVLASQRIAPGRALFFVSMFFLSGATALLSNLAYFFGERFYVIYYFITPAAAMAQASMQNGLGSGGLARLSGCSDLAGAVSLYFAARYGMRGILDLTRPWRLFTVLLFMATGLLGGFRSLFLFLGFVFVVLFFLEKLHRTQLLIVAVMLVVVGAAGLVPFARKLPLNAQRALSFLPIDVDPAARASARGSIEWRVDMWKEVIDEVPRYLLKGRGYRIDPTDLYMADENSARGFGLPAQWAIVSGDYHNGPLSVLIPFGLWGALAMLWFMWASLRLLYRNCIHGDPQNALLNRALFACFLVRSIFFLFLVGGLASDLPYLVALVALGISFNRGEVRTEAAEEWQFEAQPEII